jgi:DNA gyrase/topoisomerase IV subunit A
LIFPLILALLYVLALPYLMDLISTMVRKAKTNKIKNFYDEEVLKTQEKTKLARHQVLLEREKADSKELTDLNDRIQQLEKSNNEKDNLIKQVRKEYKDLETEYLDLSKNSINNVSKEREVIEDTLMSNEKLLNKLAMVASAWKSPTPFSVKFEMIEKDDQFHYLAKNKVIRYVPYNNEKEGKLELTELGILIWENLYKYHTSKIDNIDNIIQNQIKKLEIWI